MALELAAQLAKNGPLALIASKRILQEQFDWSSEEMWEKQGAISGPVFASEDAKEGANAFKEKREPVWKGALASLRAAARAGARRASCACAGGGSPGSASTEPTSALPRGLARVLGDRLSRSIAVVTMRFCSAMCAAG